MLAPVYSRFEHYPLVDLAELGIILLALGALRLAERAIIPTHLFAIPISACLQILCFPLFYRVYFLSKDILLNICNIPQPYTIAFIYVYIFLSFVIAIVPS